MTRIILLINSRPPSTFITEDPRPVRELVKLINTGHYVVGLGEVNVGRQQQRAVALANQNTITVVSAEPPVRLAPRHYDMLYGLADGKTADQLALKFQLSRRTVYIYIKELKERMKVETIPELMVRAVELGFV